MELRMDGRVALVTGGSMGLGRAMALAFAGAGASVAILARRAAVLDEAKAEIAKTGARVERYVCDVRSAEQIERTFQAVTADFGRIDVLVNNAGESRVGAFETLSDETWQSDFDLKVFAAIRFMRLALPGMRERRWGRIINVLNTGAKAPRGGSAPTAVSRAAGLALTKIVAHEAAPHNVLVNALLTGAVISDQWRRWHERDAPDMKFDDFVARRVKSLNVPLGRAGQAGEFAALALFLASDAGSFISGTAINVDGGASPVR